MPEGGDQSGGDAIGRRILIPKNGVLYIHLNYSNEARVTVSALGSRIAAAVAMAATVTLLCSAHIAKL